MGYVIIGLGICCLGYLSSLGGNSGRFDVSSRKSQKSASKLCKRYNELEGTE
jgi:hypothetical protein